MTKLVTKFVSVYNQLSHCALTKSMGIVFRLALGDDIGTQNIEKCTTKRR